MGAWCVAAAWGAQSSPQDWLLCWGPPGVPGKGTGRTPGQPEGGLVTHKCRSLLVPVQPQGSLYEQSGISPGWGAGLLAGRGPRSPVEVTVLMGSWSQDSGLS